MSNQLKLLLYIIFIIGIFYFIQDKFNLFEISFVDNLKIGSFIKKNEKLKNKEEDLKNLEIVTNEGNKINLKIEIADTIEKRALGLSFRQYLGDYEGMLFIYEQNVNTSFWMKDMLFSLDIIFIDEFGSIVDIKEEQTPCTFSCPGIFSNHTFKYVLEVNSGFCSSNDVKINDKILVNFN